MLMYCMCFGVDSLKAPSKCCAAWWWIRTPTSRRVVGRSWLLWRGKFLKLFSRLTRRKYSVVMIRENVRVLRPLVDNTGIYFITFLIISYMSAIQSFILVTNVTYSNVLFNVCFQLDMFPDITFYTSMFYSVIVIFITTTNYYYKAMFFFCFLF